MISLRKAINDCCKDCTYDELSGLGTWRQQTEACLVITCPLHPVRPKSKPETEARKAKRLSRMGQGAIGAEANHES